MKTITHEYLKDLYFEYKNDKESFNMSDEDRDAIESYIKHIREYRYKRNWKGADSMDDHAEMFARRLLQ